jgi:H+/gluconate symporter-like permease
VETQKNTTAKTAINFGLILGGINIVYGLMLYSLEMHYQGETATSLISYALLIGIILWAIKHFKKTNEGYISLSEALKTGMGTALISALIISIYTVIVMQYLDPEFMDKSIEYQKQKLIQEKPEIPLEDVNKMFEIQKEFSGPFIISGFIIILNLFIGFLISLIVGLIVKKSKPE